MNKPEHKKRFEELFRLFTEAHLCFFVWRGLQKKEYEKYWKRDSNFWNAVIYSLQRTWFQALANIYEDSSYSKKNKVISVYSLVLFQEDEKRRSELENILDSNKVVIENISKLRHHQLSHNNANFLLNPKLMLQKFPIKHGDIERLLQSTEELLRYLHPENNHSFAISGFDEKCEKDSGNIMKKIEYYLKREREHQEEIHSGKKPYSDFP
ncbi:MAG: hypothetical protein WC831_01630 [Parcubacteria group bacterium]